MIPKAHLKKQLNLRMLPALPYQSSTLQQRPHTKSRCGGNSGLWGACSSREVNATEHSRLLRKKGGAAAVRHQKVTLNEENSTNESAYRKRLLGISVVVEKLQIELVRFSDGKQQLDGANEGVGAESEVQRAIDDLFRLGPPLERTGAVLAAAQQPTHKGRQDQRQW